MRMPRILAAADLLALPVVVVLLLVVVVLAGSAAEALTDEDPTVTTATSIPPMLSPFGAYPNPLGLTAADRASFHPVVKFPRQCWNATRFVCPYSDHTASGTASVERRQLATPEEHQAAPPKRWLRILKSKWSRWWRTRFPTVAATISFRPGQPYIGRYDEDRVGLYESELFVEKDHADSECTKRTVHTGLDLAGPVHTPVYAFTDGTIYKAGYNPALGDYGNVIVVEHFLHNHTATLYALVQQHMRDRCTGCTVRLLNTIPRERNADRNTRPKRLDDRADTPLPACRALRGDAARPENERARQTIRRPRAHCPSIP